MPQQRASELCGGESQHQTLGSPLAVDHHAQNSFHSIIACLAMSRLQTFAQAFVSWSRDFPTFDADATMQISPSFTILPHQPYTKPLGLSHSTSHPLLSVLPAKGEAYGQHHHGTVRHYGTSIGLTCYQRQGGSERSTEHCWTLSVLTGAQP